LKLFNKLQ